MLTAAAATPGYDASADYIAGLLRGVGFDVSTPEFDFQLPIVEVTPFHGHRSTA